MLAGVRGPSAYRRRDGENSLALKPFFGERPGAVPPSPPTLSRLTWRVVLTPLPTLPVASRTQGLAWRSEPTRLPPARRARAARLAGGA